MKPSRRDPALWAKLVTDSMRVRGLNPHTPYTARLLEARDQHRAAIREAKAMFRGECEPWTSAACSECGATADPAYRADGETGPILCWPCFRRLTDAAIEAEASQQPSEE